MRVRGWHQVAFEKELTQDVSPAAIGAERLVLVRVAGEVRAFDASCPHRGAHLAFGGRLVRETIICPFHGYRIGLGDTCRAEFAVQEYPTLVVGGLVFVRLSSGHDFGFGELLKHLDEEHYFVPGFTLPVLAPATLVIENAFDDAHFRPVHGIHNEPHFKILPSERGELAVEGVFDIPPSPWQKASSGVALVSVPFVASAFSPGLVLSHLGGANSYWILTAATPVSHESCLVRLSLILPPTPQGAAPDSDLCQYLLRQSKAGLEKDRAIWENLCPPDRPRVTPHDAATQAFRKFCEAFEEPSPV